MSAQAGSGSASSSSAGGSGKDAEKSAAAAAAEAGSSSSSIGRATPPGLDLSACADAADGAGSEVGAPPHTPQIATPPNVTVLGMNDSLRALQTTLRDRNTSRSDFIFCANRLIRLVVEEGLGTAPSHPLTVKTPTGVDYAGVGFSKAFCGVTIMRAGEAMELGLRECVKSVRVGHLLIQHEGPSHNQEPKVYYAKVPENICDMLVLLMDPVIVTGKSVIRAIEVLQQEFGVEPKNIVMLSLFITPDGVEAITKLYPEVRIITTVVREECCSIEFGKRYFGT